MLTIKTAATAGLLGLLMLLLVVPAAADEFDPSAHWMEVDRGTADLQGARGWPQADWDPYPGFGPASVDSGDPFGYVGPTLSLDPGDANPGLEQFAGLLPQTGENGYLLRAVIADHDPADGPAPWGGPTDPTVQVRFTRSTTSATAGFGSPITATCVADPIVASRSVCTATVVPTLDWFDGGAVPTVVPNEQGQWLPVCPSGGCVPNVWFRPEVDGLPVTAAAGVTMFEVSVITFVFDAVVGAADAEAATDAAGRVIAGHQVRFAGSGFDPATTVQIMSSTRLEQLSEPVTVGSDGTFTVTGTVPLSATTGTATVTVRGLAGGEQFTRTASIGVAAADADDTDDDAAGFDWAAYQPTIEQLLDAGECVAGELGDITVRCVLGELAVSPAGLLQRGMPVTVTVPSRAYLAGRLYLLSSPQLIASTVAPSDAGWGTLSGPVPTFAEAGDHQLWAMMVGPDDGMLTVFTAPATVADSADDTATGTDDTTTGTDDTTAGDTATGTVATTTEVTAGSGGLANTGLGGLWVAGLAMAAAAAAAVGLWWRRQLAAEDAPTVS